MKPDLKIADSMLDLIGDIPLVRLNRVGRESGAEILVKPEFLNPSGSIKDRIAKRMVEEAEVQGDLRENYRIIEATGGNTGTALAFVSAVRGYDFVAYVPDKIADPSRVAIMLAYGCEVVTVDTDAYEAARTGESPADSDTGAHGGYLELGGRQLCLDAEREQPDVWYARQYSSPANVAAHREETAKEILDKTDGVLDAFVASVGTGGTLFGIAQALKDHDPNILIWGVEPAGKPMVGDPGAYPLIPDISDGIIPDILESRTDRRSLIRSTTRRRSAWPTGWRKRREYSAACRAVPTSRPRFALRGNLDRASESSPSCRTVAIAICNSRNTRRK